MIFGRVIGLHLLGVMQYGQVCGFWEFLKLVRSKRMNNKIKLKPCPFCGVVPSISWEPWPEISENSGIYQLKAEHKPNCFIRNINGMNLYGKCSSSNKEWLLETWNNRYEDTEEQENE